MPRKRPRMKLVSLAFGLGLVSLVACASSTADQVTGDDQNLSTQDFDETVKELTALPYLPWGYTPDGCYARAFYYSMVLATKGVPTNHLYVVVKNDGSSLGGQWRWHVAPVVTRDGDPTHLYVLDPDFSKTKALTNVEWVAAQGFPDTSVANYPNLHVWPGNSYMEQDDSILPLASPAAPVAADYKEPTFDAMPAFEMTDFASACETMHDYIDIEPGRTAAQKTAKHQALGAASKTILASLVAKQKVHGTATLDARCTRETGAPSARVDLPGADPTRR